MGDPYPEACPPHTQHAPSTGLPAAAHRWAGGKEGQGAPRCVSEVCPASTLHLDTLFFGPGHSAAPRWLGPTGP